MEWILLAPGAFLLFVGAVFMLRPPRKVNWFYGYRTPRSMRSQEAWDDSNRLAAWLILWAAVLSINTGITCMLFSRRFEAAVAVVALVTGVLCILVVVIVEVYLARAFDAKGRPNPEGLREHKHT